MDIYERTPAAGTPEHVPLVHVFGSGTFGWPAVERRSDRYGFVGLWRNTGSEETVALDDVDPDDVFPADLRGSLVAEVLETRASGHTGDLFRGVGPGRENGPAVGDRVVLGAGILRQAVTDWGQELVGLEPGDGRETDWLDPEALYRVHNQTVRLVFEVDRPAV